MYFEITVSPSKLKKKLAPYCRATIGGSKLRQDKPETKAKFKIQTANQGLIRYVSDPAIPKMGV